VKPVNIQVLGPELAIAWDDKSESYIPLEKLRLACPCAYCSGETDVLGNVARGPKVQLQPAAFELKSFETVGTYAIRPVWGDGHSSGIYSYDYLKKLGG
jgi:DUF971 family protein